MFILFIASHTIASVSYLTTGVVSAVSGFTTLSSGLQRKLRESTLDLEAARTKNTQLAATVSDQRSLIDRKQAKSELDDSIINRLAQENIDLNSENRRLRRGQTVRFRGRSVPLKDAVEKTMINVGGRTLRTAKVNFGSMAGESIPIYGVAFVLAATAIEIDMACRNLDDIYELQVAISPDLAISDDRDEVCGLEMPTKDEIWNRIKRSPRDVWQAGSDGIAGISSGIGTLDMPDFSLIWTGLVGSFDHWLGGERN